MNLTLLLRKYCTLFDDYYMNRNKYIWCIDNLYEKFYLDRYNFIKKNIELLKMKI